MHTNYWKQIIIRVKTKPLGETTNKDRVRTDLVQIRQTVRVLAQTLVLSSESISCCYFPEFLQVDHVEGTREHQIQMLSVVE